MWSSSNKGSYLKLTCSGPAWLSCMSPLTYVGPLWLFIPLYHWFLLRVQLAYALLISQAALLTPRNHCHNWAFPLQYRTSLINLPLFMCTVPVRAYSQCIDIMHRIWHSPNMWCWLCLTTTSAWYIITAHQTHSTDGQMRAWSAGLDQSQPFVSCLRNCCWWPQQLLSGATPKQSTVGTIRRLLRISRRSDRSHLSAVQNGNTLDSKYVVQHTMQLCFSKSPSINLSH